MRRGASSTFKALQEQATATNQVSGETTRVTQMIANLSKATMEQAGASSQISREADTMKQQAEQVARATFEQARAIKETREATASISEQIHLIAQANIQHALSAELIRESLSETRHITDRNARTANKTITVTTSLLGSALELSSIMDKVDRDRLGSNGSTGQSTKKRVRPPRKDDQSDLPPQELSNPSYSEPQAED